MNTTIRNTYDIGSELFGLKVRQVANLPKEKTQDFITELLDSYPKSDGQGMFLKRNQKRLFDRRSRQ